MTLRCTHSYKKNYYEFITGAIVNCLQGPAIISMRTIINKIIPSEELG